MVDILTGTSLSSLLSIPIWEHRMVVKSSQKINSRREIIIRVTITGDRRRPPFITVDAHGDSCSCQNDYDRYCVSKRDFASLFPSLTSSGVVSNASEVLKERGVGDGRRNVMAVRGCLTRGWRGRKSINNNLCNYIHPADRCGRQRWALGFLT